MDMKPFFQLIAIGLTGFILSASCSSDNDPLPQPEPEPEPEPTPEVPEAIDLSLCCNLFRNFAEAQQNGGQATLLDFSHAGYEQGEKAIPAVDYPEIRVADYGAVPNDGQDDYAAVQAAIVAAQQLVSGGARGAVVRFAAGRYDLHPEEGNRNPLTVVGNNIVLRGATEGNARTELFMEHHNPSLDETLWNSNGMIYFNCQGSKSDADNLLTTITGDAPKGSHRLQVGSTKGLSIGQHVMLKLLNATPSVVADEVAPYAVEAEWTELPQTGVNVVEYLEIAAINGNTLTFKEPLMHKVVKDWGWTLHRHQYSVGCGLEHIDFLGNFQEPFSHHLNALHDSGYRMVTFHRQVNGWIRDCHFTNVSEAISVTLSSHISILQCSINGNAGHAAIRSQASSHVLIADCTDNAGQYHSFGVSKTAIGTVLWRNHTAANTCFESHCSQPRATLIDVQRGGMWPNRAGGDAALGPNHLGDLVLWNFMEQSSNGGTFDLWVRNNRFLMPILAGYQGSTTFKSEQVTADESHGRAVYPESLYEAQLIYRLGYLPDWIQALKQ